MELGIRLAQQIMVQQFGLNLTSMEPGIRLAYEVMTHTSTPFDNHLVSTDFRSLVLNSIQSGYFPAQQAMVKMENTLQSYWEAQFLLELDKYSIYKKHLRETQIGFWQPTRILEPILTSGDIHCSEIQTKESK